MKILLGLSFYLLIIQACNNGPRDTNSEKNNSNKSSGTPDYATFIDTRKGNEYMLVKIGQQTWMAQNLNEDRFRNGDLIKEATTEIEWKNASRDKQPAWCYYKNHYGNGVAYGKLYNWYAVIDPRGLAPEGWHIPSQEEWDTLTLNLGGENIAGSKMKSKNGWYENGNGTNSSGFSGMPSGIRWEPGHFSHLGEKAFWWTSTKSELPNDAQPNLSWSRYIEHYSSLISRFNNDQGSALSVRCIKN